jgi:hypothetical protein
MSASRAFWSSSARAMKIETLRADIPCIGRLSGGFGKEELTAAGAVAVYDNVADLLEQIDTSPIAQLLN